MLVDQILDVKLYNFLIYIHRENLKIIVMSNGISIYVSLECSYIVLSKRFTVGPKVMKLL